MLALPIDPLLPEIVAALGRSGALVLEAPPGAGKSTRVPIALADAGWAERGEVLVSEPRRLAARLVAQHVAAERGERPGQTIGYSVRFEDVSSARTRVRYLTEGVLLRRLVDDPQLRGVAAVVLDEFHERSLATDLLLVLVQRLRQSARPDLGLVVMSATLDAEPVARLLGGCPRLSSEGRLFPVVIEHLDRPDDRPLDKQVVSAVRRALREGPQGDVLVFLPGAAEIRRAREALSELAQSERSLVLPLHGDLPLQEQARAVAPASERKIVLSTNVAETSVTIDGVTVVVDAGLARIASHSPWSGLPRLELGKISRASATQRAGRAGRTRPGRVLRLYTKGDFEARPEHDAPEIRRVDLCEAWLTLHGSGIEQPAELGWLDPPPPAALAAAESLLGALGALGPGGTLSEIGRRLLAFPLHPRLARLVVEGERLGVAERACLAAALLGERDLRLATRTAFGERAQADAARGSSDVLELMDRFDEAAESRFDAGRLRWAGIDARTASAVDRAYRQLRRIARDAGPEPDSREAEERAIRRALLRAFPDRVARRARPGARELVLSGGGSARLAESSVVHDEPHLVAVDVEERGLGRSGAVTVRLASGIDPDWLLDLDTGMLHETDELGWSSTARRVERVTRLSYGSVVLDETRGPAPPSPDAARVLARAARAAGLGQLAAETGLEPLLRRWEVLREQLPEAGLPDPGADPTAALLERACEGLTRLDELEAAPLAEMVLASLSREHQALLRDQVPERVALPSGRSLAVHYEPGKPPWIESRLQDFFGMATGPSLCKGRLPLTLHLLAPNGRAVQVTTDLAGFWERHYPGIRKELMRRYPRHLWPEDGRHAAPPKRGIR